MKTYVATYFLGADTSGRRKSPMARVFAKADSQEDAFGKMARQAKREGYVFAKLEGITVLETDEGLGVTEGIRKASEESAYIEPFDRGVT